MLDKYTKAVLTVIAASLVWIASELTVPSAHADPHFGSHVLITGISEEAAKCIAAFVTYAGGDKKECVVNWGPE
jgi:hypothetical protein